MDVIWVRRNVSMDISVADLARSKSLSITALFVCSTISWMGGDGAGGACAMEAIVAGTVSIEFLGGLPLGRGLIGEGGSCTMEAVVARTVSIEFSG